MSSSPEVRPFSLPAMDTKAPEVTTARFDVDLRAGYRAGPVSAEAAKAAAQAAGYADGWAQGQRAAWLSALASQERAALAAHALHAEQAAALKQAVAAVAGATAELERRVVPTATEWEEMIVGTAVDLAEALLDRELSGTGVRATDAVRRAMSLAPSGVPVTLRLNPADYDTLVGTTGAQYDVEGRVVSLVSDAQLAPGDSIAECGATRIDASLVAARARVRELLES